MTDPGKGSNVWLVMREGVTRDDDEWTEIVAVCATEEVAKREQAQAEAEKPAPNVISQDVWIDEHEVIS